MANIFDDLNKLNNTPDARAARDARRAQRQAEVYDRIGAAMQRKQADMWDLSEAETKLLDDRHPGVAAVAFVREALSEFTIPSQVKVEYSGMKRSSGHGAHALTDGVILVKAELRSLSGARHYIDVPVAVLDRQMVYPEVLVHQGRTRVMAQSTFDDIVKQGESAQGELDRKNMYSPPPDEHDAARIRSMPKTPRINSDNMFRAGQTQLDGGHLPSCDGEMCGGEFECQSCKKMCGWCRGADDERYDWCDDCAAGDYGADSYERGAGKQAAVEVIDKLNPTSQPVVHMRGGEPEFQRLLDQYGDRHDEYVVQLVTDDGDTVLADNQGGPGGGGIRRMASKQAAKPLAYEGNPTGDGIDEAERERSTYLQPGQTITLSNEVELRGRGGTVSRLASGTKGTVIRDMMGNDRVYYVQFDGCKAPINKRDIA